MTAVVRSAARSRGWRVGARWRARRALSRAAASCQLSRWPSHSVIVAPMHLAPFERMGHSPFALCARLRCSTLSALSALALLRAALAARLPAALLRLLPLQPCALQPLQPCYACLHVCTGKAKNMPQVAPSMGKRYRRTRSRGRSRGAPWRFCTFALAARRHSPIVRQPAFFFSRALTLS